jgi:hypothetical protein
LKGRLRLCAALLIARLVAAAPPPTAPAEFVQAVEFPYYLYPHNLWERELVWLKNIGIQTVEFSIPWNYHQLAPGDFDFTGRTSPRRDLVGFIKLLRRVGLHGWARTMPPVDAWPNRGCPPGNLRRGAPAPCIVAAPPNPGSSEPPPTDGLRIPYTAIQPWLKAVAGVLATQTVKHGGAIAYVDNWSPDVDAPQPPGPVMKVAGNDADALARSRSAITTGRGALVWTEVEDALYPAGWAATPGVFLRKGAVGLAGDERGATSALRRDAALLRAWGAALGTLRPAATPKPAAGKFPPGVTAVELISQNASAVSIGNRRGQTFQDDLSVVDGTAKHSLTIPAVRVPAGETLWLPVGVSLGPNGLCRECSNFSAAEQIVYATAELFSIEYENGILAMEFAAPEAAQVVLQLARRPVGPFLAAGKPVEFEWDDKTLRARLPIPRSTAADHRVRIAIAMEEPETSAFFNDSKRMIVGAKNIISTTYSSPEVAARSRLRTPDGYTASRIEKTPNEIDYEIAVPADAAHGDYANFALEADGMALGRARLQLFRPLTVRLMDAINIHFGQHTEMTPDPPVQPVEPKAGTNLVVSLRNNWPAIQTYKLEAAGDGLEFFPAKTEITIGAMDERQVELRVFGKEGASTLRECHLKITGGETSLDIPVRLVMAPRGKTVAWTADLDGDGSPEWILDSPKARAVFSSQDGGRWTEFTWKDGNVNFLPEQGAFAGAGPVEVRANGDGLEFTGKGWTRMVRLADAALTMEQSVALPTDGLRPGKQGNISLSITRQTPSRAVYSLGQ